jgi:iron(III) transport system permease protein
LLAVAFVVALPLGTIVGIALKPAPDVWRHLFETVLWPYVFTTLTLGAGVGVGTFLIGTLTAWLVTYYRFPGRNMFEWALLVPLAVPAYVIAYTYTDLLEYAGPVQGMLRDIFGWTSARDYWFPEIRSVGGAILMFTLVLYPYVYLLARSAFLQQSSGVLEVSRTLGRGPWRTFWAVALPMARPAIVVGLSLAVLETLNDFGTVDYFAVRTLTYGIFDAWFGLYSVEAAAQLALSLLLLVMVVLALERHARRGRRFQEGRARFKPMAGFVMTGPQAAVACVCCLLPVLLGFVVPAGVLVRYALINYETSLNGTFFAAALHSVTLAGAAAVLAVAIGIFMAYALRLQESKLLRGLAWISSLGYGMPGAILAVGAVIPVAWFDNQVDAFMRATFGISTGLLLSGTAFAVVMGYVVRFLVLSFGTMESGLAKVTRNMDDAARSLGYGPFAVLRRVHLPMLRASMLTAGLLVFVDCMKELPMTLLLRPFNYETLSTFVYQFAKDELLEDAALGALTIVAVGIGPVILLTRAIRQSRPGQGADS